MSEEIAGGVLRITGDASGVSAAMAQAERAVARFEKQTVASIQTTNEQARQSEKAFAQWRSTIALMAERTATALAVAAAAKTAAMLSEIRRMDELARRAEGLGVATSRLSALERGFDLIGNSADSATAAIRKINEAMVAAAAGDKSAAALFGAMGISIRDASGQLIASDQVLLNIADRFRAYKAGASESALATKLFGEDLGSRLLPALNQGSVGLQRAMDDARRFGLVVEDEVAAKARKFSEDINVVKASLGGLTVELTAGVLPALAKLAERMATDIRSSGGIGASLFSGLGAGQFADPAGALHEVERRLDRLRRERDAIAGSLANRTPILRSLPYIGTASDLAVLDAQIAYAEQQRAKISAAIARAATSAPTAGTLPAPIVEEPKRPRASSRPRYGQADLTPDQAALIKAHELVTQTDRAAQEYAATLRTLDQLYFDGAISVERYEAATGKLSGSYERAGNDGERLLEQLAKGWIDVIDPVATHVRQLEEIRRLVALGKLTPVQGFEAEFVVQERIQGALDGEGMKDDVRKAEDAARRLGMTFTSAFEDAMLSGQKLSGVLRGIGQDVGRVFLRKSITEPAGTWLASVLDFSKLLPGHRDGLDYVPYDNYPALLHRGERVQTAEEARSSREQITFAPQITIHGEPSRTQQARLLADMQNVAVATFHQMRRRGA